MIIMPNVMEIVSSVKSYPAKKIFVHVWLVFSVKVNQTFHCCSSFPCKLICVSINTYLRSQCKTAITIISTNNYCEHVNFIVTWA